MKDKYVIYSTISPHGGRTVDEILSAKQEELVETGYSLWSVRFNSWDRLGELLASGELDEASKLVVYCVRKDGSDPLKDSQIKTATHYDESGVKLPIPNSIKTTYGGLTKYAYLVSDYEILKTPEIVDFGQYEVYYQKYKGKATSFSEAMATNNHFRNFLLEKNDAINRTDECQIVVKLTLKYPFVVELEGNRSVVESEGKR